MLPLESLRILFAVSQSWACHLPHGGFAYKSLSPAAHDSHEVAPGSEYVDVGHAWHDVAPEVFVYVPWGQARHILQNSPVHGDASYLPAEHTLHCVRMCMSEC